MDKSSRSYTHLICVVRQPRFADLDRMANLAGQLGYPSSRGQIQARLDGMVHSDQHAVFVAELSVGEIGGWIGVFVQRSVEMDDHAVISGLVVDQNSRCRGIGKVLLQAAAEWAMNRGCRSITVSSNVQRNRAHQFYEDNGFKQVKIQIVFHKSLDSEFLPGSLVISDGA